MTAQVNNDVQKMSGIMPAPSRKLSARQFAKILAHWGAPADFRMWVDTLDPTLSISAIVDAIPANRARWYWWLNSAIYRRLPETAAGIFNRQDGERYAEFMHAFDELAYDRPAREQAFMRYKRRAGSLIYVMLVYIFTRPVPAGSDPADQPFTF